jgi:DNA-binding CsgD family transcriptional regulator
VIGALMFGREPDRAQIEGLLDGVPSGPLGIGIEGVPGIGKTTLWRETLYAARRRGWRVLSTAPSEPDHGLAFAGLGDLFEAVPMHVIAALPNPLRRALATALSIDEGPAVDQQTLPRAALTVLRSLAAAGPLVVAVDDEQWLDRPTARVLAFALNRLGDEPVCLLLSRRPNEDAGSLFAQVADRYGVAGMTTVRLEPLDAESIGSMLEVRLGGTLMRRVLRQVYETSGGNPLYALAIARSIEMQGATHQLTIPRTLVDAMAHRLGGLEVPASMALLVIAAAAAPTLALLQAVIDGFALHQLDAALDAELIYAQGDQLRFTHPLLASTHYARAPASHRRLVHRRLSVAVADQVERAQHLALGAEMPDRDVAAQLARAADVAARRGAPEAAADLLEHAIRLTPLADAAERWSRALAAAEQLQASGEFLRSEAVLEPVLRSDARGRIRAQGLRLLSRARGVDDFVSAGRLLEEALHHARDDPDVRSKIGMDLAVWANNRGDFTAAVSWARAAVASAEESRHDALLAQALGLRADAEVLAGAGIRRDLLERALAIGRSGYGSAFDTPCCGYGRVLFWSDCLDEARPLLEEALRCAREEGHEPDRLGIAWLLAFLEFHAGNPAAAAEYRRSTDDAEEIASDDGLFWNVWIDSWTAAGRGELERARALAEEGMSSVRRSGGLSGEIPMAMVLGAIDLWTGRPDAAHERLEAVRTRAVEHGFGLVGAMGIGLWSTDIEALAALDRLDEAEALVDDLLTRAHASENPHAVAVAHRSRGLLLAARHELAAALEALDAALAAHALRPLPGERARTLLEKGTVQRRTKHKTAAKQSLEQALTILEPLGFGFWVARARDELGRIGLRRAAVADGPTPAQRRVADLLATGASNREIAGGLHMSVRSVESHLTNLYRQFGVRSRAQLVATLATGAAISSMVDDNATPRHHHP